ncbi:MAG: hypothetical protein QXH91_07115, partial [Candidatus Bathyarchaeia archaeon]
VKPQRGIISWRELSPELLRVSFDKVLGVELLDAIRCDSSLFQEIKNGSSVVNLIKDPETLDVFFKGLSQLKISDRRIQKLKLLFSEHFHRGEQR